MSGERRLMRVFDAVASAPAGNVSDRLCSGAAELLDTPGVGIAVATGSRELHPLNVTGPGRKFDRVQFDLGEGPAWTAHGSGWPATVPDLEQDGTWLAFGPAAVGVGLRAVFAFPLRRGSARLGALTLYRRVTGELTSEQHADAVAVARVAVDLVLAAQAGRPVDDLAEMFDDGFHDEAAIHQASGMVSVQLGVAVAAALAVLRAHAFTTGRSLRDVAADVVLGELRMGDHVDP